MYMRTLVLILAFRFLTCDIPHAYSFFVLCRFKIIEPRNARMTWSITTSEGLHAYIKMRLFHAGNSGRNRHYVASIGRAAFGRFGSHGVSTGHSAACGPLCSYARLILLDRLRLRFVSHTMSISKIGIPGGEEVTRVETVEQMYLWQKCKWGSESHM
jgi:hypothetical protein